MLAHGSTEAINTWGFAYTGGIMGLFVLSLLYVKTRVTRRAEPERPVTMADGIASFGPSVIAVGGVCGVSLGLGIATVLGTVFVNDDVVDDVLIALCDLRGAEPVELSADLHDDVEHAVDDLDAPAASAAHRALHEAAPPATSTDTEWTDAIDQLFITLAAADSRSATTCEAVLTQ